MSLHLTLDLITLVSLGVGQAATTADKELSNLQGVWSIVSVEHKGKKQVDTFDRDMKLTIRGNKWSLARARTAEEATIALDTSKKPWGVDLEYVPTGTPPKPVHSKGILKLDGDTLTWCHAGSGNPRPDSFDDPQEGKYVLVWKRVRD